MKSSWKDATVFAAALALLLLSVEAAGAVTKTRTCGLEPGQTLQHFLDEVNPGDTLLVSGTCNENVVIGPGRHNIVVDGQGSATISAPDNSQPAVNITGRNITLKGFALITGGKDGITVIRGGTATIADNIITGAARDGIIVNRGGEATIKGNTVQNSGRFGINLNQNASGRIVNNTVESSVSDGILVDESSSGRIGLLTFSDTASGPNTIRNNGRDGIRVYRASSAVILANEITGNAQNGVDIGRGSQADVGNNNIDSNHQRGILVRENSVVTINLTDLSFDGPNTGGNPIGLQCIQGAVAKAKSPFPPAIADSSCVTATVP